MIKKMLYFITILLSLFNVGSNANYNTKSYINNHKDIYTIQNYCIENNSVNKNCYTISTINLHDKEFKKQKLYYTLNKKVIKDDFYNIDLNKLLSNNN